MKFENTTFQSFEYRANGFFSDGKSGSYLSKFFFTSLFFGFYQKKIKTFFQILIIIIILSAISVSGERAAILNFFIILGITFLF